MAGLHRDRPAEPGALELRSEVIRPEIAAQPPHRIVYPAVFARVVCPEVLVSVDTHSSDWDSTPGRVAHYLLPRFPEPLDPKFHHVPGFQVHRRLHSQPHPGRRARA